MNMDQFAPQGNSNAQGNAQGGLPAGFNAGFGFKVDPKQAGGFDAIPAGNYEVIITAVEPTVFKSQASGLKLTLTVRDDVAQPYEPAKKRKLFTNLVAQENCLFQWQGAAVAVGRPAGEGVTDIVEFGKNLLNKPVLAKVGTREYNGETQNDVKSLSPSKVSPAGDASAATTPGAAPADPFAPKV